MATALDFADGDNLHSAVSAFQLIGDHLGTFAFAVSGALLAVHKKLDIVGIATLAAATAVGGGIIRDLVIGTHPPAAFVNLTYLAIALLAALIIFFWHPSSRLSGRPLDIADALGLGVFCVTGTLTAADAGLGAPSAALLGLVTAVGGGVIRDILAGQTPLILRPDREIYAIPALLGSSITAGLLHLGYYSDVVGAATMLAVFGFRWCALHYEWRAPSARQGNNRAS
ncbi:putative transmembrane protein [Nocardia nova SH22a]|uniref:Putative transmembrane protein n=1 Tax=Nocardia nova SH22a TaxID=1415166 RepID=W5TLW2_9NOCA|nr:trimeric intracellular cation channel family protein [Nocardia nova]AHH19938.1 putative transmembrane protein [Nocardia nova SH22a]